MPLLHELPTRAALMQAAADRLEHALAAGLARNGAACAALSGGTTPEEVYKLLAQRALDWQRVRFALVDERFVPPSDPASNEAMLRRALAPALARGATLAPMYADAPFADAAARANAAYAALHFDIALMGMGADGHTASWFPGAEGLAGALDPASRQTVVALHAPGAAGSAERLSLSLAAAAPIEQVLLVFTGAEKLERFNVALKQDPNTAPIAALARAAPALDVLYAP